MIGLRSLRTPTEAIKIAVEPLHMYHIPNEEQVKACGVIIGISGHFCSLAGVQPCGFCWCKWVFFTASRLAPVSLNSVRAVPHRAVRGAIKRMGQS